MTTIVTKPTFLATKSVSAVQSARTTFCESAKVFEVGLRLMMESGDYSELSESMEEYISSIDKLSYERYSSLSKDNIEEFIDYVKLCINSILQADDLENKRIRTNQLAGSLYLITKV